MKLKAKIIKELANPNTVFMSLKNCKKIDINPEDYEEERFIQIKNVDNYIWHSVFIKNEASDDEILIPKQLAVNLPDIESNSEVEIEKWTLKQTKRITSITLEKRSPPKRSLASRRDYLTNIIRNIPFPVMLNFLITVPVELANKEIVEVVLLIKKLTTNTYNSVSDNICFPYTMPPYYEKKEIEINIAKLGNLEEDSVSLCGFSMIGGLEKQIQMVREVVELPFAIPKVFAQIGVRPSKGILLHGPPGTGKTLIAKAVAQTTKAKFIKLNASELFTEFVGRSEEQLRSIFEEAAQAERAIIFIDEIDALAVRRDLAQEDFSRRLVGQFLPLLDGMDYDGRIVVIAATNRIDAIDPAFRRPGRFDREIQIGIPDRKDRYEILKIHSRRMNLSENVNFDIISELTHGYVGADLEALCREAGIQALNEIVNWEKDTVSGLDNVSIEVYQKHFQNAIKTIVPSIMREVKSDIPNVDWDHDIVGMDYEKKELIETIEVYFSNSEILKSLNHSLSSQFLLVGPKGSGRKTLTYALSKRLGLKCIKIDLLSLLFNQTEGIEAGFKRLKKMAQISSPSIILLPSVDSAISALNVNPNDRMTIAMGDFLDDTSTLNNIFIIMTTESEQAVPLSLFQFGRIDHIINMTPLSYQQKKLFLLKYLPPEFQEQHLKLFIENFPNCSAGELLYLAKQCILYIIKNNGIGYYIDDTSFKSVIKHLKVSVKKQKDAQQKKEKRLLWLNGQK